MPRPCYPSWLAGDDTARGLNNDWEAWTATLKVGDRCDTDYGPGVVMDIDNEDDFVTVKLDNGGSGVPTGMNHLCRWYEIRPEEA